ncbi:MAG: hypothetical protein HPY85_00265 [Anaerolineae bacterium]|nr:hypothetical protein [Anaerolineae bacterium]
MSIRNLIILSQLNPPAQRSRVLIRERVSSILSGAFSYPLTILQAGTGYGKSTAIISFVHRLDKPVYWYTITGSDRDPRLFLAKLFTAFNQHGDEIGDEALRILDMPDATQQEAMIAFINALSTRLAHPTLMVLDDFHRVRDIPEIMALMDWMIENIPSNLHMVISSRQMIDFPSFNKWRVKGALLEITRDDLTFTAEEVQVLFESEYGIKLTPLEIDQLLEKTEGWAIGLQMVWQSLQNNPGRSLLSVLEDNRESRMALFDYLAEEVLSRQDASTQQFLLRTSILSKLDSATCDFLMRSDTSDEMLRKLHHSGLFIEELRPGLYRYHQIFREFLLNRLQQHPAETIEYHRTIASYFTAHEYWEEAIYHLLSAGDYRQVNQILQNIGERMIMDGRQESINYWINAFPESVRRHYPYVNYLLGEVNRFASRFDQALEYYHSAERIYRAQENLWGTSMALRGQAQVFLDTIRPVNADQLLQDALRLLNPVEMPQEVADLLVLTAENQLNLGSPDSAESLLQQARALRPELDTETDLIQARLYLRTGRLREGIRLLEERESTQVSPTLSRPQRFHREASLLLSLFYSLMGDIDGAERYAQRGIQIGEQLQSTFVQSVGIMRLGHTLQLRNTHPWNQDGYERAITSYRESMRQVDVVRIHVEPLWGICRALGYSNRVVEARQVAQEALAIAEKAGDVWIRILVQVSLGAGEVLAGNYDQAQHHLSIAESAAIKVKDPFALSAARLWLAVNAWYQGYRNTAFVTLEKLLPVIRQHQYDFLLTRETYLGLKDREMILPLLLAAREHAIEPEWINHILSAHGLLDMNTHPGYTLWVKTFSGFAIWRGTQEIDQQEWKREKARQLMQLLVAHRGKWMHRDQLINMLWPETLTDAAANNLKVVFNALNQVLEPERVRGAQPFFVERQQELYRLNPTARIMIDTELFEKAAASNTLMDLEAAVDLYQGHYFEDSYVQEWLVVEEQFYHQQFLLAAEKLTHLLIDDSKLEQALEITFRILAQDNVWESAYRLQMRIFHRMGRYSMVRTVYKQCVEAFERQFNAPPSPKIRQLYEELLAKEQKGTFSF